MNLSAWYPYPKGPAPARPPGPSFSYLTLRGVGFKFWKSGDHLSMDLGFTHYVSFRIPVPIRATVRKNRLLLSSPDKQQLNNYVYFLRAIRFPDPYKGKGVRFFDETVALKVGKVKN